MKYILKTIGAAALLMVLSATLHAANTCQRTDIYCHPVGPSQNQTTPYRVDSSGNITAGNVTSAGTVSAPTVSVTGFVGLNAYSSTTIQGLTPTATFELIGCTGCTTLTGGSGVTGNVCVSSGTTIDSWVFLSSSTLHCQ